MQAPWSNQRILSQSYGIIVNLSFPPKAMEMEIYSSIYRRRNQDWLNFPLQIKSSLPVAYVYTTTII